MSPPRRVSFYLDDALRQSAQAGRHNFIGRVASVLRAAGYVIDYRPDTRAERLRSATRRGHALFHMAHPFHARALTMRRAYHYPFWAIEPTSERWDWHVAHSVFDPAAVDRAAADRFHDFWRNRLFGDAAAAPSRDGYVYVPLQGRLADHRRFQVCAPLDMLRHVLTGQDRPVVATLHPNETYSDSEHRALAALADAHPRLTVATGDMARHLGACDLVVTQNSSVAFSGFYFGKPAVLFARVDFHHIAANAPALGIAEALRRGPALTPDYAGYLHWYWQLMSINAGHPDAEDRIAAALRRGGWPL